jgi:hypothetical protein
MNGGYKSAGLRFRRPQTGPCAINKGQFDKLTDRSEGFWSLSLSKGPPDAHRLCQLRVCEVPFLFLFSPPVLNTLILAFILQQVMIPSIKKLQKKAQSSFGMKCQSLLEIFFFQISSFASANEFQMPLL